MKSAFWDRELPPFSFLYGGQSSSELLPRWACEGRTYHAPDGFRLAAHVREFEAFPATEWVLELINHAIVEHGIDIYRHDFNNDPLPYWQAADAADRVGMTEIRYIEGLYAMWDELRRRHPGLIIDSCASGGKRIDLETISRSLTFWRSDFQYMEGPSYGRGIQVGDQSQSAGLARWLPLSSQAVWTFSPYDARSALSAGMVLFSDVRKNEFPSAQARLAIEECKRLRPYLLGNFHQLLPLTVGYHDWCAYQYHRQDSNDGFALFLRRHESPFPTIETSLREIDPQRRYHVVTRYAFDDPSECEMNGADLIRRVITIAERPGSALCEYRVVPPG